MTPQKLLHFAGNHDYKKVNETMQTIIAAAAEIERLSVALKVANSQSESLERKYHLRGHALKSIKDYCESMPTTLTVAIMATCNRGIDA